MGAEIAGTNHDMFVSESFADEVGIEAVDIEGDGGGGGLT